VTESNRVLGLDSQLHHFDHLQDCLDLTHCLLQQARRQIYILTPDLEFGFYDQPMLVDQLSALLRHSRYTQAKVLIGDIKPAVGRSHALRDLAERLPSKIQMRVVNKDYPSSDNAWLLADNSGLMFRKDPHLYKGFVSFQHPARNQQLQQEFQRMWDYAFESPELRRLGI